MKVRSSRAQTTIEKLKAENYIDYSFKIYNENGFVFIPVSENFASEEMETIHLTGRPNPEGKYPSKHRGSFDLIGEIAVIHERKGNASASLAESILKYNKVVRSVYLDRGISGQSRKRTLELLAGVDNKQTLYKESGITLKIDLSKAYFSPRLASERMRVARSVKDGEYIIDMFAGIGPFSILIAKTHNVRITAIDNNSDAISILKENMKLNRLTGEIDPVCDDAGDFIRRVNSVDRVIMNLPHNSASFLDGAFAALRKRGMIHYYEICTLESLEKRMEEFNQMGLEINAKREVHGYSRNERMYALDLIKIL